MSLVCVPGPLVGLSSLIRPAGPEGLEADSWTGFPNEFYIDRESLGRCCLVSWLRSTLVALAGKSEPDLHGLLGQQPLGRILSYTCEMVSN